MIQFVIAPEEIKSPIKLFLGGGITNCADWQVFGLVVGLVIFLLLLAYFYQKIMEKMMQKPIEPKGQRFCPVDPYGEENWEE